jgi:hypothetical protein
MELRDSLRGSELCFIIDQLFTDRVFNGDFQFADNLDCKVDIGSDGLHAWFGIACRINVKIESLTNLYA